MISNSPYDPYFIPTRQWIEELSIGDSVSDCFAKMQTVTEITHKGEDINGKLFVCLYMTLGEHSSISGVFKEGELHRSTKLTFLHNSAELDRIEAGK